ncbi:MAG: amino acid ABC transporter permease [Proteobacteria bacterium]|nr:amino acid ABC transporter permease [Pseudomonadota bacterium]
MANPANADVVKAYHLHANPGHRVEHFEHSKNDDNPKRGQNGRRDCGHSGPARDRTLTAFEAGVFALTLFCSSHVGEIVRGALQAIPKGQTEAARAIGLTFGQIFVYVLLPQAMRQMLPTWVNTATEIVKASTLLSIIGVVELLLSIQQIISRNFLSLEFYFFAGFIYFLINFGIEKLGRSIERKVAIPA